MMILSDLAHVYIIVSSANVNKLVLGIVSKSEINIKNNPGPSILP